MFYFAYRLGLWTLNQPSPADDFELSVESITASLSDIGGPFLFGCLILGIISATIGYFGMRWFWRWHVVNQWRERSKR